MEVAKWAGATLCACRSDLARIPGEPEEASIPVVGSDEAETILIVEDDTDFRTHLAGVLRGRPDPGIDLIQKPISQAALANRIRQALDRRRRFGRMVARSLSPLMKSRHSIVSFRVDDSIFRCADALAVCAIKEPPQTSCMRSSQEHSPCAMRYLALQPASYGPVRADMVRAQ